MLCSLCSQRAGARQALRRFTVAGGILTGTNGMSLHCHRFHAGATDLAGSPSMRGATFLDAKQRSSRPSPIGNDSTRPGPTTLSSSFGHTSIRESRRSSINQPRQAP